METSPDTPASNPTRELAAIMFSDVVGYTAIMGRDEQQALRALEDHRELLRQLLPKFNGRMVGEIGDGTLTSFHSALDAVNCARAVQAALDGKNEFQVRIGIHVGDVVFSNNDVYGDGVNVASRIHGLAAPGGICVSASIYDEVRNKPGARFKDLGEKRLKNVSRPIHVYQLIAGDLIAQPEERGWRGGRSALIAGTGVVILAGLAIVLMRSRSSPPITPQTPTTQSAARHPIGSIAVLPLDNFSGDPNQEYFSDGMTDELTTDLATISALRVISRGSVMQFKGEHRPPTPEIAKALNVDAVVEGSVMRVGDKVRITAQLIDARVDKHLWAKSYERDTRNVLAMQDEVASAIAKEINVQLTPREQTRLTNAAVVNPAAHDAFLKGIYFVSRVTDENITQAIAQLQEAIKLDPKFASAYAELAFAYNVAADNQGAYNPAEMMPKEEAAAERAVQLDDNSALAHASLAEFKLAFENDWVGSEREFRRAIELNPNLAAAHDQLALVLADQGRLDEALAENQRATELDPLNFWVLSDMAITLAWQEKYEAAAHLARTFDLQWLMGWIDRQHGKISDAIAVYQTANVKQPSPIVTAYLGYAYGASGDHVHAMAMLDNLNKSSPHGNPPPFLPAIVYLGMGDRARALDGLEKANAAHSTFLTFLKMDRMFDPLRTEPRFIALMKKLNFEKGPSDLARRPPTPPAGSPRASIPPT